MIYSIQNLTFSYHSKTILENLSFDLEWGKLHVFIGANGAGKSTLIKLLAGLAEPDKGNILFDDKQINQYTKKEKARKIAYMAQNPPIPPDFTVREIVQMARFAHRKISTATDDEKAILSALKRTGTLEYENRSIGELSGGERQRVMLATAFAQETDILLLDEVTSALDMNHSLRIMDEIRTWVDEGKTAVMILHDINMAARFADRLWLMANGAILACGTPKEVITETLIKEAFHVDALIEEQILTGMPTIVPFLQEKSQEMKPWYVIGGGGSATRIYSTLFQRGITLETGILNEGDSDLKAAKHFGYSVDSIPAFEDIPKDTRMAVQSKLGEYKGLLVPNFPIGLGNVENMLLIEEAKKWMPVYYLPWNEKQYIAPEIEERWNLILEDIPRLSPSAFESFLANKKP